METKKVDKSLVAYPKGRLDLSLSSQLEEELSKLIDEGNLHIVLNFKNVEYMSSSGFRACIATLRKLNMCEGSLKISCIHSDVSRIFEVMELDSLFDIYETEEEALKAS